MIANLNISSLSLARSARSKQQQYYSLPLLPSSDSDHDQRQHNANDLPSINTQLNSIFTLHRRSPSLFTFHSLDGFPNKSNVRDRCALSRNYRIATRLSLSSLSVCPALGISLSTLAQENRQKTEEPFNFFGQ